MIIRKLAFRIVTFIFCFIGIVGLISTNVRAQTDINDSTENIDGNILYTYEVNNMVFESDISIDTAWYTAMKYQYDQGLITKDDWDSEYSDFISDYVATDEGEFLSNSPSSNIETLSSDKTTYVTGRLRWELPDGTRIPLKFTKVDLFDKEFIGATQINQKVQYTHADGTFSFNFQNDEGPIGDGGLDLFIRWYPESSTFKVAPDWVFCYFYGESEVIPNVSTGSTTSFYEYVKYDNTCNANKSFYVQQGMVVGQRFATEMGMNTSNFLSVAFPFDNAEPFCWAGLSGISSSYFNNWDCLIHEYGHFVESYMGNYGSTLLELLAYDPEHDPSKDLINEKSNKHFAMDIVWSESWATTFSIIAQEYFKSDPDYSNVPGFGDGIIFGWDYEVHTPNLESGEAQEYAVTAFLWDLFDSSPSETNDNIALGYADWWAITTVSGTCTFTDFVNVVDEQYPSLRNSIAEIMGNHQIAPNNFTITNKSSVSISTPPILSWTVNGSIYNPNDSYQVVFFDLYGDIIYVTNSVSSSPILSYNQTFNYEVSQSDWNEVVNSYGGNVEIYVAVRGFHSQSPISGPYYSKSDLLSFLAINAYQNDVYNCNIENTSQYEFFRIIPTISGYYDMKTTGNNSTLITLFDQFRNEIDFESIELTHYLDNEEIYYIMIRLSNYEVVGSFNFSYSTHIHNYSYEFYNTNPDVHLKICYDCGFSVTEPHYFSYGRCIHCGADCPTYPYIAWEGIEPGIGKTYFLGDIINDGQEHLIRITGEFGWWEVTYPSQFCNDVELVWEGGIPGENYVKAIFSYSFGYGTITFNSCYVEWGSQYPIPDGISNYDVWIVEKIEVIM